MTSPYVAGPKAAVAQAPPAPPRGGLVASAPTLQVRRPASDIAAALPADPFARRSWPGGRGGHRLSGRPAVLVLASLIVALLASSAAPTPLYAIYPAPCPFTPLPTTVPFALS